MLKPTQKGTLFRLELFPEWRRKGATAEMTNKTLEAWRQDGKDSVIVRVNQVRVLRFQDSP